MPGRGAIAGRLVVVPDVRRAGKSTLSAAPTRAGHRVFSDDVVPFSFPAAAPARGLAMGIAPRLRLPMTGPSAPAAMEGLLSQRPACVARQIGETLYPADPERRAIHRMDPLAAAIRDMPENPGTLAEIEALLVGAFPDPDRDRIAGDLRDLMQALAGRGADRRPDRLRLRRCPGRPASP